MILEEHFCFFRQVLTNFDQIGQVSTNFGPIFLAFSDNFREISKSLGKYGHFQTSLDQEFKNICLPSFCDGVCTGFCTILKRRSMVF